MKSQELEARRIVVIDGARINDLSFEAQEIRREIARLNARVIGGGLLKNKAQRAQRAERDAKVAELEKRLHAAQTELDEIQPRYANARKAVAAIDAASEANRRAKCADLVNKATDAAVSRQPYLAAREKLSSLRSSLVAAERELGLIERTAPTVVDNAKLGAELLLAGEPMPKAAEVNAGGRERELRHQVRTLSEAIRIQGARVLQAERVFCAEIASILRPAQEGIVQRIANGFADAREATNEASLIRVAVGVACGGSDESLPAVNYPGITPFALADGFDGWRDRMRGLGWNI